MHQPAFKSLPIKVTTTLLILFFLSTVKAGTTCDSPTVPIVFVHGFMGAGDNWSLQARRFVSQGHCPDRLYMFDWNSMGGRQRSDSLLEGYLRKVLQESNAEKLVLVAHSAGGGLCYRFLKDSARASMVSHYIHIGSSMLEKEAGPDASIPTLVIGSRDDKVVPLSTGGRTRRQLILEGKDHMEVASCRETFEAIFSFIHEKKPLKIPLKESGDSVSLSGKAVLFGNNIPMSRLSIRIYRYDGLRGRRLDSIPWKTLTTDEKGRFSTFRCQQLQWLEFELSSAGRDISYFLKPGTSSDYHVYLRGFPEQGLAAMFLKGLPYDSARTVTAIFSSDHALIAGRDSLFADSMLLTNEVNAPASRTLMAIFLFDNGDGKSSYEYRADAGAGIFLTSIDMAILPGKGKTTRIRYQNEELSLPNKPSDRNVQVAILGKNNSE
jgi:hypothetical protein